MAQAEPETILCDTSFLAHAERRESYPERYAHWPQAVVDRLEAAILAVTPFSYAEMRAGRIAAGWGPARSDGQEARLARLLLIPIDFDVVDAWAELRADGLKNGWALKDNDLWIAATARARDIPLVSSDSGHRQVPDLEVVYLPIDSSPGE